jgi:two-component system phosphate regulon response regulator PhoB
MSKARILVIEDEEDILALIQYNLIKAGYRVECVTSGEEGVAIDNYLLLLRNTANAR